MRIEHQRTEAGEVALLQQLRAAQHAFILADRVDRALGRRLGKAATVENPLGAGDIAQMRDRVLQDAREVLRRILARLAAAGVGAVDERVLRIGLHHHERDRRTQDDILELAIAEVALHEAAFLAVERGGLVEKAARAAGERVLGLLTNLRERGLVLLDAIELAEREGRTHLKRGGRGEAHAERDVAEEHALPALARLGGLVVEKPVERARDVVLPGHLLGGRDIRDVEFDRLHEVAGRERTLRILRRGDREERPLVDGRREDEALVVVGVVAEHLDAPRGIRHRRGLHTVEFFELGHQFVVDFLILHERSLSEPCVDL